MTQQMQTQDLRPILQTMEESWREFVTEVESVPPDDFCRDPGDGEWSVKRQVEHCIGSEVYFASLIIHAMGMDNGRQWERDRLIGVLGEVREETLSRLPMLTPELLDRKATHPDAGEYTIRDVLEISLTCHPRMHVGYVHKVRGMLTTRARGPEGMSA